MHIYSYIYIHTYVDIYIFYMYIYVERASSVSCRVLKDVQYPTSGIRGVKCEVEVFKGFKCGVSGTNGRETSGVGYRGTSHIRNSTPSQDYHGAVGIVLL